MGTNKHRLTRSRKERGMKTLSIATLIALLLIASSGSTVHAQEPVYPAYDNTWSAGSWQSGVYDSAYGYRQGYYHATQGYNHISNQVSSTWQQGQSLYNQGSQFVDSVGGFEFGGFDQGAANWASNNW